ncbi:dual specificity protein phosphatase family protein [Roseibacterium sp. KMU-115]|uniref:Dual specificity protein phosphatase family protein n=2 Tax=Roseicyclus persicicus TaxID=2650661 RepID=A0A7X6GYG4_9RHOB|nr:dual specificity protein phosphatase family protein [Roseibacterium persicicum]
MTPWRVFYRYWVRDHAWLRVLLPNFYRVDADLYRGNHPGYRRLARYKALGIRSVLTLRGEDDNTPNLLERDACERLGLELRAVRLRTVYVPPPATLLELVRLLREMPKPMLVHCKSGADRTGLAVTLYLHVIKGQPLEEARRALSWRYAHFSFGKAGVVHRMLDAYAADRAATGIDFEDWVATRYDPAAFNGR